MPRATDILYYGEKVLFLSLPPKEHSAATRHCFFATVYARVAMPLRRRRYGRILQELKPVTPPHCHIAGYTPFSFRMPENCHDTLLPRFCLRKEAASVFVDALSRARQMIARLCSCYAAAARVGCVAAMLMSARVITPFC